MWILYKLLYVLFFQKGVVGKIFRSIASIDNDPRLNRVSTVGFTSTRPGYDHRMPGTRTNYRRNVSALLKKKVAASQQWKCATCNNMLDETYEVDHVIALEHGGSNDPSNLRALCPHCHRKKTVEERNGIKRNTGGI
jgi:5-methylcytosine-specific restriction endonuclease McrA